MSTVGISTSAIDGVSGALSQIDQIKQQLQGLEDGSLLDTIQSGAANAGSALAGADPATTVDFASALAAAQSSAPTDLTSETAPGAADAFGADTLSGDTLGADALSLYGSSTGGLAVGTATGTGATLPASASRLLTSGQQQFASTLAADTGLNPSVVTSWLLAEESGTAAQSRQAAGNNDWLNIGYTDSATYGSGDSVWSDPVSAANATAQWLKGEDSIPGYGTASAGIQAILQSVGQSPQDQIAALQSSGWASSGYPDLGSLYDQVSGGSL